MSTPTEPQPKKRPRGRGVDVTSMVEGFMPSAPAPTAPAPTSAPAPAPAPYSTPSIPTSQPANHMQPRSAGPPPGPSRAGTPTAPGQWSPPPIPSATYSATRLATPSATMSASHDRDGADIDTVLNIGCFNVRGRLASRYRALHETWRQGLDYEEKDVADSITHVEHLDKADEELLSSNKYWPEQILGCLGARPGCFDELDLLDGTLPASVPFSSLKPVDEHAKVFPGAAGLPHLHRTAQGLAYQPKMGNTMKAGTIIAPLAGTLLGFEDYELFKSDGYRLYEGPGCNSGGASWELAAHGYSTEYSWEQRGRMVCSQAEVPQLTSPKPKIPAQPPPPAQPQSTTTQLVAHGMPTFDSYNPFAAADEAPPGLSPSRSLTPPEQSPPALPQQTLLQVPQQTLSPVPKPQAISPHTRISPKGPKIAILLASDKQNETDEQQQREQELENKIQQLQDKKRESEQQEKLRELWQKQLREQQKLWEQQLQQQKLQRDQQRDQQREQQQKEEREQLWQKHKAEEQAQRLHYGQYWLQFPLHHAQQQQWWVQFELQQLQLWDQKIKEQEQRWLLQQQQEEQQQLLLQPKQEGHQQQHAELEVEAAAGSTAIVICDPVAQDPEPEEEDADEYASYSAVCCGYGSSAVAHLVNDPVKDVTAWLARYSCMSDVLALEKERPLDKDEMDCPNCKVIIFKVQGVPLPFLVATRPITKGTTLYRSYGLIWWRHYKRLLARALKQARAMAEQEQWQARAVQEERRIQTQPLYSELALALQVPPRLSPEPTNGHGLRGPAGPRQELDLGHGGKKTQAQAKCSVPTQDRHSAQPGQAQAKGSVHSQEPCSDQAGKNSQAQAQVKNRSHSQEPSSNQGGKKSHAQTKAKGRSPSLELDKELGLQGRTGPSQELDLPQVGKKSQAQAKGRVHSPELDPGQEGKKTQAQVKAQAQVKIRAPSKDHDSDEGGKGRRNSAQTLAQAQTQTQAQAQTQAQIRVNSQDLDQAQLGQRQPAQAKRGLSSQDLDTDQGGKKKQKHTQVQAQAQVQAQVQAQDQDQAQVNTAAMLQSHVNSKELNQRQTDQKQKHGQDQDQSEAQVAKPGRTEAAIISGGGGRGLPIVGAGDGVQARNTIIKSEAGVSDCKSIDVTQVSDSSSADDVDDSSDSDDDEDDEEDVDDDDDDDDDSSDDDSSDDDSSDNEDADDVAAGARTTAGGVASSTPFGSSTSSPSDGLLSPARVDKLHKQQPGSLAEVPFSGADGQLAWAPPAHTDGDSKMGRFECLAQGLKEHFRSHDLLKARAK